jgi:hypothetical protein
MDHLKAPKRTARRSPRVGEVEVDQWRWVMGTRWGTRRGEVTHWPTSRWIESGEFGECGEITVGAGRQSQGFEWGGLPDGRVGHFPSATPVDLSIDGGEGINRCSAGVEDFGVDGSDGGHMQRDLSAGERGASARSSPQGD